jgi:glutaredoxin
MRVFLVLAALLLLLFAGVVHIQRGSDSSGLLAGWIRSSQPESASSPTVESSVANEAVATKPATPSPGQKLVEAGELSVLEAPARDKGMVRYTDDQGSIHMVRSMAHVPTPFRESAVALGSAAVVNRVEVPVQTASAFRDWRPIANPNTASPVLLYSANWCGACKRAKSYLKAEGVAYRELDIDRDPGARHDLQRIVGRVAIPLLDVRGQYVSGFKQKVYAQVLGLSP